MTTIPNPEISDRYSQCNYNTVTESPSDIHLLSGHLVWDDKGWNNTSWCKTQHNCANSHTLLRNIDGLVQERHISIANALESRLPCTNPLIYKIKNRFKGYVRVYMSRSLWDKYGGVTKPLIYRIYIDWRGRIFWELYILTIIHKMYKVLYIGIIIIVWYQPESSPTAYFQ